MPSLNFCGWLVSALSAAVIGISKTGIPGSGILAIPAMAEVLPARSSTGVVLVLLIFADMFAVAYYKRHAVWGHLLRILPFTAAGIVLGYLALGRISDRQLQPVIGGIVLTMLLLNFVFLRDKRDGVQPRIPSQRWFAAALGLTAGVTTMMANAAGPILVIYLVAMRLPKQQFIGTSAWYFLILNWVKVPFSANLGLINLESLRFNLALFPLVALGAAAGIFILKRIPQKVFSSAVQALAGLAAVKLLLAG